VNNARRSLLAVAAVSLLLGALAPAVVCAMDADELIAKYLEASGGMEKIQAVKSRESVGKLTVQGMEIPFTMINKRPDKLRVEATVMGMMMVQGFDGQTAWAVNPMTGSTDPQTLGELETKGLSLQADMDGILVNHADKGYDVEYLGEDEVEGTPVYKLRVDTHKDMIIDFYFDREYFLPVRQDAKITMDGNEVGSETYLSDYRDVDGLMIPFSVEVRQGGQVGTQIMLESVKHDVDAPDADFVMSSAAAAQSETSGDK